MDDNYYLIDSAERTSRSASVQETRTLLYIMGQMSLSKDIDTFVIDVVNDVVSVNRDKSSFVDAQSKGEKSSSPKSIGSDLVTLYKDYLSIFDFDYYILSLRNVSNAYLNKPVSSSIKELRYSDFTIAAQKLIRDSLIDECLAREYIHKRYSDYITEIDQFLKTVIILINNDSFENYIEKIAFVDRSFVSNEELLSIFEDIRIKQQGIKTSCEVSGTKLFSLTDQLNMGRNLKVETINSLVLERITGMTIINQNKGKYYCPAPLISFLANNTTGHEEQTEFLEDAVHEIYKAFCNTNLNKEFWDLILAVSIICRSSKTKDVESVYRDLLLGYSSLFYVKCISKGGMLYLIANIMEGMA